MNKLDKLLVSIYLSFFTCTPFCFISLIIASFFYNITDSTFHGRGIICICFSISYILNVIILFLTAEKFTPWVDKLINKIIYFTYKERRKNESD